MLLSTFFTKGLPFGTNLPIVLCGTVTMVFTVYLVKLEICFLSFPTTYSFYLLAYLRRKALYDLASSKATF